MKTVEEIKKGLNACTDGVCDICPYKGKGNCGDDCMNDALHLIQQLEETIGNLGHLNETMHNEAKKGIQELESRLARVERERDAAVNDLTKAMSLDGVEDCSFCKNIKKPYCDPCKFEWRGVCPENTKED